MFVVFEGIQHKDQASCNNASPNETWNEKRQT